jgi:hypothetical protein
MATRHANGGTAGCDHLRLLQRQRASGLAACSLGAGRCLASCKDAAWRSSTLRVVAPRDERIMRIIIGARKNRADLDQGRHACHVPLPQVARRLQCAACGRGRHARPHTPAMCAKTLRDVARDITHRHHAHSRRPRATTPRTTRNNADTVACTAGVWPSGVTMAHPPLRKPPSSAASSRKGVATHSTMARPNCSTL